MATTYGISLSTLRLIQKKKEATDSRNAKIEATQVSQKSERTYEEFSKLQECIRQEFENRHKTTINQSELVNSLMGLGGIAGVF